MSGFEKFLMIALVIIVFGSVLIGTSGEASPVPTGKMIAVSCMIPVGIILLVVLLLAWTNRRRKFEQEDGAYIGYKVLDYDGKYYRSPQTGDVWKGGQLKANVTPSADNPNGIYIAKSKNDPRLTMYAHGCQDPRLVKVRLESPIAEHASGARANRATIIEDYSERKRR